MILFLWSRMFSVYFPHLRTLALHAPAFQHGHAIRTNFLKGDFFTGHWARAVAVSIASGSWVTVKQLKPKHEESQRHV